MRGSIAGLPHDEIVINRVIFKTVGQAVEPLLKVKKH